MIGLNRKDNSILDELDGMLELFINLNSLWKTASNEKKLEYIAKVVLELNFNNEKRLYIKEEPLFKAFQNFNRHKWWSNRLNGRTFGKSNLVQYWLSNQQEVYTLYKELKLIFGKIG